MDFHGPDLGDDYVYPHVPLGAPYQQRLADVLLHYALLVVLEVGNVLDQEDASAPRQVTGLAYPDLLFICSREFLNELLVVVRHLKGLGSDVVDGPEHRLYTH